MQHVTKSRVPPHLTSPPPLTSGQPSALHGTPMAKSGCSGHLPHANMDLCPDGLDNCPSARKHWAPDQGTIQRDHHRRGGAIDKHHPAVRGTVLSCHLHAYPAGQASNDGHALVEHDASHVPDPRSSNTSLNRLRSSPQMTVEGNSVCHTR